MDIISQKSYRGIHDSKNYPKIPMLFNMKHASSGKIVSPIKNLYAKDFSHRDFPYVLQPFSNTSFSTYRIEHIRVSLLQGNLRRQFSQQ